MADFKIIETQEELNAVIKDRLEREQKKHSEATAELQNKYDTTLKEFEALKTANDELNKKVSSYDEKYKNYDSEMNELRTKVKNYESDSVKTRICKEVGIPEELKGRLHGDTEEDIKKDAEELKKIFPSMDAPRRQTEVLPSEKDDEREALRDMLKNMK